MYGQPYIDWVLRHFCGKITSRQGKPGLPIFTTACFAETWCCSRKRRAWADLEKPTNFVNRCIRCPVAIHQGPFVPSTDFPSGSALPAFMYDVRGPRTARSHTFMVKILKQLLYAVGESPELFAGHSLRRGGTTPVFALGVHASCAMVLGDWASLAVLGYNDGHTHLSQCLPLLMAQAANT